MCSHSPARSSATRRSGSTASIFARFRARPMSPLTRPLVSMTTRSKASPRARASMCRTPSTTPRMLRAGDVVPAKCIATRSASPSRVMPGCARPSPTVVGGPISDWPTSASMTATWKPREARSRAICAASVVLPASLGPITSVTRDASAPHAAGSESPLTSASVWRRPSARAPRGSARRWSRTTGGRARPSRSRRRARRRPARARAGSSATSAEPTSVAPPGTAPAEEAGDVGERVERALRHHAADAGQRVEAVDDEARGGGRTRPPSSRPRPAGRSAPPPPPTARSTTGSTSPGSARRSSRG